MDSSTDFAKHNGRGAVSGIISAVLLGIASLLYILRAWTACRLGDRWRWDFIWASLAMVFAVASFAFGQVTIQHGMGVHLADLSYPEITQTLRWFEPFLVTSILSSNLSKFGVMALYIQVQGPMATARPRILWTAAVFFSVTNIILIFLIVFGCNPVSKTWNYLEPGTCHLQKTAGLFSIFQSAVSALTDLLLGFMPITLISSLQISKKAKISFCVLMGLSAIPGIASVCRGIIVQRAISGADVTYTFLSLMTWCDVELWAIMILGSIPPIRPLFLRTFHKISPAERVPSRDETAIRINVDAMQHVSYHEKRLEEVKDDKASTSELFGQKERWVGTNACVCEYSV